MALNLNEITNVITTQPTSDQELKPCNARWNTDFLESCSPITDGIIYCCCGCICEGLLHARTGEHFCSCLLPCSTQSLRTKIRMAYAIKGSLLGDYLASSGGQSSIFVYDEIKLHIMLGDIEASIVALIVKQLCTDCILGMDFINKYKLIINTEDRTISIRNNDKRILLKIDSNSSRVHSPGRLINNTRIPPKRTISIPVSINSSSHVIISSFFHVTTANCFDYVKFIINQNAKLLDTSKPTIAFTLRPHGIKILDHAPPVSQSCYSAPLKQEAILQSFQRNPPKCNFFQHQIDYLSHTISEYGVKSTDEKSHAIIKLREPTTLAEANKFLGALSWYRKFIPQFATIPVPIHVITNLTKPNKHKFRWNDLQKKAFLQLKELFVNASLFLNLPNDNYPIILTTDASKVRIEGTLQQIMDAEIKNLYYHSQFTSSTQRR
ncbi:unnamed protein product [Rotaria magnacalcarata]|uniref:Reverse transcriptase/retrotransposon-derived protein RNase H-like domain-containing protein n=1 Tax=Rotaria magnacalcarata TaxID=392030 RepID=A0A819U9R1_9BILA|nr:unnamed protein product [Rotaria magnacalcarata]